MCSVPPFSWYIAGVSILAGVKGKAGFDFSNQRYVVPHVLHSICCSPLRDPFTKLCKSYFTNGLHDLPMLHISQQEVFHCRHGDDVIVYHVLRPQDIKGRCL